MRSQPSPSLENYRVNGIPEWESPAGTMYGAFQIGVLPTKTVLHIISSGPGEVWEHVSVSIDTRTPTWAEMCRVKELFWDDEETVIQFHPGRSKAVNHHPFCLHLWKLSGRNAELPPRELI